MVNQAIWLTATVLLLLPGSQSQSIPTVLTCPTRTVTLPDSKGLYNIQHSSDPGSDDTCELTLEYTSDVGSFALVEGVYELEKNASCKKSQILIGTADFCIDRYAYMAKRTAIQQSTLLIKSRAAESNFTISVYLSSKESMA